MDKMDTTCANVPPWTALWQPGVQARVHTPMSNREAEKVADPRVALEAKVEERQKGETEKEKGRMVETRGSEGAVESHGGSSKEEASRQPRDWEVKPCTWEISPCPTMDLFWMEQAMGHGVGEHMCKEVRCTLEVDGGRTVVTEDGEHRVEAGCRYQGTTTSVEML